MSQSLICNYIHIIFSTKNRRPMIDDVISDELFNYIGGICKNLECYPLQIGGYRNLIHALCNLSKKIALMKLLEDMKKSSSKWIKTKGNRYSDFYWQACLLQGSSARRQDRYGAFSVSPPDTDAVINYIKNQAQHHKRKTFENEFLDILSKYHIGYDERYIWD